MSKGLGLCLQYKLKPQNFQFSMKGKDYMKHSKEDLAAAYHEAGHALLHFYFDRSFKHIQVGEDEESLGMVLGRRLPKWLQTADIEVTPRIKDKLEKRIKCLLAGRIAEKIFTRVNNREGANYDMHIVSQFADYLVHPKAMASFIRYLEIETEEFLKLPQHKFTMQQLALAVLNTPKNRRGIRRISGKDAVNIIRKAMRDYINKKNPDSQKKLEELLKSLKKQTNTEER